MLANPLAEGPREFIVLTEMQAECFFPAIEQNPCNGEVYPEYLVEVSVSKAEGP